MSYISVWTCKLNLIFQASFASYQVLTSRGRSWSGSVGSWSHAKLVWRCSWWTWSICGAFKLECCWKEWINPCDHKPCPKLLKSRNITFISKCRKLNNKILLSDTNELIKMLRFKHKLPCIQLTKGCLRCSWFLNLGGTGIGSFTGSAFAHFSRVVHQAYRAGPRSCSRLEHLC